MREKFYITTPLYYVNASPHIGHSYTNIAVDCLARYYRNKDCKVHFLTGTDEHGQKIQQAAEAKGQEPIQFADEAVSVFKGLWNKLNISNDDFIRTTEERHVRFVQRVLEILKEKGELKEGTYTGWYCTPCETFWPETQTQDQNCPDCKRPLEKITEKNYFFSLSKHQDWLIDYINKHDEFIKPASRREEVLSFLKLNKLTDLCVSRPKERLNWGIPLTFSPQHVTYVWFDALINYISAVGSFDDKANYKSQWWPADVHMIGKDILRQHAVYWPIMLHALNIEPPRTILAHGWWLIDESKMSKSIGNVVSPLAMIEKYGIDVYRYFLLKDVPFGADGNFSEEAIVKRLNGDLANDLGNFVYRTLTMIEKYIQGIIPEKGQTANFLSEAIEGAIKNLDSRIAAYMGLSGEYNFSPALEPIWELINLANKYVEDTKPWILFKEDRKKELKEFIVVLVDVINAVTENIAPFMPATADSIRAQFGKDKIKKGKPLFPRIEQK